MKLSDILTVRQMMIFIDGENLVFRFQEMLDQGRIPLETVKHLKDIFVWEPSCTINYAFKHEILRATYYTYATGDENAIKSIIQDIKEMRFAFDQRSAIPNCLYPCVFKKANKQRNGKGVDIKMTVDILNHIYSDNCDTVWLFTGDGDYLPVVEEVIRAGKQLYLSSFSSGLNPELKAKADLYYCIDNHFFKTH